MTHLEDESRALRVGLIGAGIGLSRTPRMHVEEGAAHGLAYTYDLIDTAETPAPIQDLLARVAGLGYRGVNVTHPFKQAVMAHLDLIAPEALAVGAVNTVVFEGGQSIGYNTDHWGFCQAFAESFGLGPQGTVLLLGAGGAGGAVAHGLLDSGVERLWLFDRDPQAAARLAAQIAQTKGPGLAQVASAPQAVLAQVSGVVNATPMGMAAHPGTPMDTSALRPDLWVADIVYFPLETAFLRAARALGCPTMSGAGMAVYQAVRAFELFTGIAPNVARMKATFDSFDRP